MLHKDAKRTNVTDIEGCYTQSMIGRVDLHKFYDSKIANNEIQWITKDESVCNIIVFFIIPQCCQYKLYSSKDFYTWMTVTLWIIFEEKKYLSMIGMNQI